MNSKGNILSKYPLKKIVLKSKGVSTLTGRKIWYDEVLNRLNVDERGRYLGEFDGEDKIAVFHADGSYELSSFELNNHFDSELHRIEKYVQEKIYTIIHQDGGSLNHYVKRFTLEN